MITMVIDSHTGRAATARPVRRRSHRCCPRSQAPGRRSVLIVVCAIALEVRSSGPSSSATGRGLVTTFGEGPPAQRMPIDASAGNTAISVLSVGFGAFAAFYFLPVSKWMAAALAIFLMAALYLWLFVEPFGKWLSNDLNLPDYHEPPPSRTPLKVCAGLLLVGVLVTLTPHLPGFLQSAVEDDPPMTQRSPESVPSVDVDDPVSSVMGQ